jgi:hypothetical protein
MADDELTPPSEDTQDDQPDKDWQAEATKWKALARKHEKAAKDNADAARRLAEIEKSGKTEQERLAEARRTADERAVIAEARDHFADVPLRPRQADAKRLGDLRVCAPGSHQAQHLLLPRRQPAGRVVLGLCSRSHAENVAAFKRAVPRLSE